MSSAKRLGVVGLVVAVFAFSVGLRGFTPPAGAQVDPDVCAPNSSDTSFGAAGSTRCIAERLRTTRTRHLYGECLDARALVSGAEYTPSECRGGERVQAEAIAHARAIVRFDPSHLATSATIAGISPDIQWEVMYPRANGARGGRIDILVYDRATPTAPVWLIEVKRDNEAAAIAQLQRYVEDFPMGESSRPVIEYPLDVGIGGAPFGSYADEFQVVVHECSVTVSTRVVDRYEVTAPSAGVLLVAPPTRSEYECSNDGLPVGPGGPPEKYLDDVDESDPPLVLPAPQRDDDEDGRDDLIEEILEWLPEIDPAHVAWPALPPVPVPSNATVQLTAVALVAVAVLVALCVVSTWCLAALTAALASSAAAATPTGSIALGVAIGGALAGLLAFVAVHLWGDPHLATFDRLAYDLQSVGEFHLLEIPSDGIDVQARFGATSANVSELQRVAFEINGSFVELAGGSLFVDGEVVSLSSGEMLDLGGGAAVFRSDGQWGVLWPGWGDRLAMVMSGSRVGFHVPGYVADERGLLGNNNGRASDDLALRDGTVLSVPVAPSTLHGTFADSWRITDVESLFSYGSGQSTASFTDMSFPSDVVTLGDFTDAEVAAGHETCATAGVVPGPQFQDCVFDVVVMGDDDYADDAALVTDALIDATAHTFDENGELSEDFEGTIGPNFVSPYYSTDTATSRVAAPIFDTPGYRMYVRSIGRHSNVHLETDLIAYGPIGTDSEDQTVDLVVDGTEVATIQLDGTAPTLTSELDGTIEADGSGTITGGTAFKRFHLELDIPHAGSSIDVGFVPHNFRGVLTTALGIDDISMQLTVPAAQQFEADLPIEVPSSALPATSGAGVFATLGAQDEYTFTVDEPGRFLLERGACPDGITYRIVSTTPTGYDRTFPGCGIAVTDVLVAGDYRLDVAGRSAGSYDFRLTAAPAPQTFALTIGSTVAPDEPDEGAGNIETIGSVDVYEFTVPAGGLTLSLDDLGGNRKYRLYNDEDETLVHGTSDRYLWLDAGEYRLAFDGEGWQSGTYSFRLDFGPEPEVFEYTLGTTVAPDEPDDGAGNIETIASVDRYDFTIPSGGMTLLYDDVAGNRKYRLFDSAENTIVHGTGDRPLTLAAGDYHLDFNGEGWQSGTYSFRLYDSIDQFAYTLGSTVSNGVPAAGAGNMETTSSVDRYDFTVPSGGMTLIYDDLAGNRKYHLFDAAENTIVHNTGDRQLVLAAGNYHLDFGGEGWQSGTYSFRLYDAIDDFAYTFGDTVSNGVPGTGAGNMETTMSIDRYDFTVPTGGRSVLVDDLVGGKKYRLYDAAGNTIVHGTGDRLLVLAAGAYHLDFDGEGWQSGTYSFKLVLGSQPDVFTYTMGPVVSNGVPASGAGNMESTTAVDQYNFTVPTGGQAVLLDDLAGGKTYELFDASNTSVVHGTGDRILTLAAGAHRLQFSGENWQSGTYSFRLAPLEEAFNYTFGSTVSNGVPAAGAGNMETTSSVDRYDFTVPSGGMTLIYDDLAGNRKYHLFDAAGNTIVHTTGDRQLVLAAGSYHLDFGGEGWQSGTYSFRLYDAIDDFDFEFGTTVSNGVPGTGAGNMETTMSIDRYEFTVPTGGMTLLYDDLAGNRKYHLYDSSGNTIVHATGDRLLNLTAGAYRLDFDGEGWQSGTYSFRLGPATEAFAYTLGSTVSNGAPSAGAGNMETTMSIDRYNFTVPSGGLTLTYDDLAGNRKYRLYDSAENTIVHATGDRQLTLSAGTYHLNFDGEGWQSGTYSFRLYQ